MYLWEDKGDEDDDIEINWTNDKMEEAKKIGYVQPQKKTDYLRKKMRNQGHR